MNDTLKQTVRLRRPARVTRDERGRSVWSGPVEETELELVSTSMLKQLLAARDEEQQRQLEEAAAGKEGVLAQNLSSGRFEIIDDADLRAALDRADRDVPAARPADVTFEPLSERADRPDEELSLVSTQALRRMLGQDEPERDARGADAEEAAGAGGGFDPYNSA